MSNQTISRENNDTSRNIETLKEFYSVVEPIPSRKRIATDRSSLKKVISLQTNLSEDINAQLAKSVDRLPSFSITYNFSVNLSELSSLPFNSSFSKLIQSAIHKKSLEYYIHTKNRNISQAKIEEYFSLQPSTRSQLREKYAAYIKSTEDVFDILKFGNTRSIVDAYDGAVDLLAECDEDILTHAIEVAREKYISDNDIELAQSWEKNWEILIKAVSCALKIEPHRKMSLLLLLCDSRNKLSRLIKLTLIDAIVDLDFDQELIMVMLQIFMSERESDNFVRNYASEQAEEYS